MSPVTLLDRPAVLARRAARTAVVLTVPLTAMVASPATADVPEGWSDPEKVDPLHALLVIVGAPLGLALVITLLVLVPALKRGERVLPDHSGGEAAWLGGPRQGTKELPAADSTDSRAGGASGSW